jgi:hypothetical protein
VHKQAVFKTYKAVYDISLPILIFFEILDVPATYSHKQIRTNLNQTIKEEGTTRIFLLLSITCILSEEFASINHNSELHRLASTFFWTVYRLALVLIILQVNSKTKARYSISNFPAADAIAVSNRVSRESKHISPLFNIAITVSGLGFDTKVTK